MISPFRAFLPTIAGLALAACVADVPPPPTFQADQPVSCPRVAAVKGVDQTPLLVGDREAMTASIGDFQGQCQYRGRAVSVNLTLPLVFDKGPGFQGDAFEVEYFVAVADPNRKIIGKETFTVGGRFADTAPRVVITEQLSQIIPLPNARSGQFYEVLVGFQVTGADAAPQVARPASDS